MTLRAISCGVTPAPAQAGVHGADIAADDPIAWYEGAAFSASNERHLRSDWQGSIVLTAEASSGSVIAVNRYDEYGIPQAGNAGRFGYTGQAYVTELGMYYYKARMYSATLGRFMQTDPIGYADGLNMYAYVGNDPTNMIDPSGLCEKIEQAIPTPGVEGIEDGLPTITVTGNCQPDSSGSGNVQFAHTMPQDQDDEIVVKGQKQSKKKASDPCRSLGQKIGNALENAGKGVSYSGLTIAGIGAFAGPEGAAPGLFITEVGGVLSTLGQVSQDIAFNRPIGEIAGRALVNTLGARAANNVIPRSVRSGIGDAIFGQALGEFASATNGWLDPDRCQK